MTSLNDGRPWLAPGTTYVYRAKKSYPLPSTGWLTIDVLHDGKVRVKERVVDDEGEKREEWMTDVAFASALPNPAKLDTTEHRSLHDAWGVETRQTVASRRRDADWIVSLEEDTDYTSKPSSHRKGGGLFNPARNG